MSYQVLARKWRPQRFAELVGQDHVKTALCNALASNRLHHAYLFSGTRGVGKTTIARIFAKSLNCERGVTAEPCGVCSACTEIDSGHFVDLLEIDAASRTKVEDTRDLLDNVQYAPSRGRYKVYLIDEVHMLSRHSFNALLKTLEEPPPHVKFLLATTDPQKLPVTVLSRCLQFNLKALNPEQISLHLAEILTAEHIAFEDTALSLLAKAAKGSLRDALSLTDQAIAQSNSQLSASVIRDMLGYLEHSWSQLLLQAIIDRDLPLMHQQLVALMSQHSDSSQILDDMLSLLHLAALTQLQPAAAELAENADFVRQLAASQPAETLQLYYQLLISGKKELAYAPDLFTGLEMAMLRALAFVPATAAIVEAPTRQAVNTKMAVPETAAVMVVKPSERLNTVVQQEALVNQPVTTAEPATEAVSSATVTPAIDPVTASIMARRGMSVAGEKYPPEKKSERQQAPVATELAIKKAVIQPEVVPAAVTLANEDDTPPVSSAAPAELNPVNHAVAEVTARVAAESLYPDEVAEDDIALWQAQQEPEIYWPDTPTEEPATLNHFDGQITEDNFSVRFAAQVDPWAARVEQLACGGLVRLFLLNAAVALQNGQLTLRVIQSQQHLDTPAFRDILQQLLTEAFSQQLAINIIYQSDVPDCPLAIQQRIEIERRNYVLQLLQHDPNIQQFQQRFAAEMLHDTVQVS